MKKLLMSCLLATGLLFADSVLVPSVAMAQNVNTPDFTNPNHFVVVDGDGTEESPYEVVLAKEYEGYFRANWDWTGDEYEYPYHIYSNGVWWYLHI